MGKLTDTVRVKQKRRSPMRTKLPTKSAKQKSLKSLKALKAKKGGLEKQYEEFFVPRPSPLWLRDEDNFSLEQPSPLKWVPSETTYGIDVNLCPTSDA